MRTNCLLLRSCLAVVCISVVGALSLAMGHGAIQKGTSDAVARQVGAPGTLSSTEAKRLIADRAGQAIRALKAKNMKRLSALVHPVKGVWFSPYAHVAPGEGQGFNRKQVAGLWAGTKRYGWGSYDGSGEPIRLSFRNYYKRFVYDRDFAQAKQVGYNAEIMGSGNTLNNIREAYPRAIIVEYHFPGTKDHETEWKSLWMAFEKSGGTWYLAGIVHGEWTI